METMKSHVNQVFDSVFPDGRVVSTKVIGRLDNLYSMALKLKQHKKFYKYYKKLNQIAKKAGEKGKKMFLKRRGCCKGLAMFDAEDYFKKKIRKKCL